MSADENNSKIIHMNIEEFVKLDGQTVDLVNISGGGTNSHYVYHQIESKVMELIADGKDLEHITNQINDYLSQYVLQDDTIEKHTAQAMKKLGFKKDQYQ